ncbi:RIO1 family regulatory kinase/ATPase domain-containing protein [Aestuariimicrobium ganziense]|uniref:RIO1 family regulatory kinase/ATPase domain-containing protein n=1 Tax=Aestuariimicrobium ganziense TaxID=2773677 RepID=UPI001944F68F|nr:RIO1 family regulatory kinase/ATPase [Aestuariimicrobium ganziense]
MPRRFDIWSDNPDHDWSPDSDAFTTHVRTAAVHTDWDVTTPPPPGGDRWTTWDHPGLQRGPEPHPDWVVTSGDAHDTELGVLKTGKEADAHLLVRTGPETSCMLVAKRYRGAEHTLFHNTSGYTQARTAPKSRDRRAIANRTRHGRAVAAGQWADTEWTTLVRLWNAGVTVPYPVSRDHHEILMEFIDAGDGAAAPRLVQTDPTADELSEWFEQFHTVVVQLARLGLAHADLSPYNILVRPTAHGRSELVVIDWPQVVDVIANSEGMTLLQRDISVVCRWFAAKGHACDPDELFAEACSHLY